MVQINIHGWMIVMKKKIHDGQGNIRQVHRFGKFLFNKMEKAKVEKPHI